MYMSVFVCSRMFLYACVYMCLCFPKSAQRRMLMKQALGRALSYISPQKEGRGQAVARKLSRHSGPWLNTGKEAVGYFGVLGFPQMVLVTWTSGSLESLITLLCNL